MIPGGVGELKDDLPLGAPLKMPIMRSMACDTLGECMVASTRWPVFGGRQRGGDRLKVTHLPHDDHVWVLPEDMNQGTIEGTHIGQHFCCTTMARLF